MTGEQRLGCAAIAAILAVGIAVGYALGGCSRQGSAPESGRNDYIEGSATTHYTPSDVPPEGLPAGTVAYEVYDNAADMRYWVFRWPSTTRDGESQWSVVPRLTQSQGQIYAYEPPTGGDSE